MCNTESNMYFLIISTRLCGHFKIMKTQYNDIYNLYVHKIYKWRVQFQLTKLSSSVQYWTQTTIVKIHLDLYVNLS